MNRFARVVLGYHGCTSALAGDLVMGKTAIDQWEPSRKSYDWLGNGIYFWEHGPRRAQEWSLSHGRDGGVVGAVIQLGRCLDLADTQFTDLLPLAYDSIRNLYAEKGWPLPKNEKGNNALDCLVINAVVVQLGEPGFQTVRCPFLEGDKAFPDSTILRESHIQIAVIDTDCILGVFRPNITTQGVFL